MAIGERKQGKTLSGRANRVQPEIQVPIARAAMSHLADELEILESLYREKYVPPEGKADDLAARSAWLRKRNAAIVSQLDHIKRLSQAASGCIHPTGHNTSEEKEAAAEMVEEMKRRVASKLKRYDEGQAALQEAAEQADPDGEPGP